MVEFLTDNTLGRIWYEMRKGDTKLKDQCRYMVRRPTEVFLNEGRAAAEGRRRGRGRPFAGRTAQAAGLHPAPPEERPSGTQDPRPGLRQRPLPAVLLRPAADDLRGSLRRPRPRPGAPGGLPDAGRSAAGRAPADPAHNLHGIDIDLRAARSPPSPSGCAASGPIRRWG